MQNLIVSLEVKGTEMETLIFEDRLDMLLSFFCLSIKMQKPSNFPPFCAKFTNIHNVIRGGRRGLLIN